MPARPAPIGLMLAGMLWACHPACGTDRYYRDLSVMSADGKLRLDVKSPDNAGRRNQPFAKNFVYIMSETATGRSLWDRSQAKGEGSPIRAFVHDGGWVVVRTGFNQLLLIDNRGGVALNLDILKEGLPADDVKEYVQETTAGPQWADYSHWYFFTADVRPYFAVRTWWDRRIIISLQQAKQVSDERLVRQAANAAERKFVLATLQAAGKVAQKWSTKKLPEYSFRDEGPWDEVPHLYAGIHLAGRIGLQEAAPFLRELEPIPSFGTSASASEVAPAGGVLLATCRTDRTRQQVQLALRRIGEKPAGYPVREAMQSRAEAVGEEPYHPARQSTPRADRVATLKKRLAPTEVVDAVGAPDYVLRPTGRDADADWVWEYDIDADIPYTLRIVWAGRGIWSIEKVKPAAWKDGKTRDLED